ncbi:MAG: sigma-70 family RNA polymerase sigma factor [Raoultibacter sp.]
MTEDEFCTSIYEYRHLMYHIAYVHLHNSADCEDAVQEAVCKAWHKKATLVKQASMRAWLSAIVANESKSMLRKRRNHPQTELDESMLILSDQSEENQALREALHAMPTELSLPVVLHYLEGFSTAEIASILKRPEGTVRNRLFRARQQLRQWLTEEEV